MHIVTGNACDCYTVGLCFDSNRVDCVNQVVNVDVNVSCQVMPVFFCSNFPSSKQFSVMGRNKATLTLMKWDGRGYKNIFFLLIFL